MHAMPASGMDWAQIPLAHSKWLNAAPIGVVGSRGAFSVAMIVAASDVPAAASNSGAQMPWAPAEAQVVASALSQ